ncbi:MAG: hypothetical protein EOP56_10795 [Sphingobacteriales bacterium]|nr:MAG: hypothetical protein EOP56_10795 [Sphingobacteriales bacterium]
MNIKLSYLYRDGANYKQFNEEIFSNRNHLELGYIDEEIRKCLIDGEWFYVDQWGLKYMHVHPWDNEIDHTWHEFDSVEEINEKPTTAVDISELLAKIMAIKL